MVEAVEQFCRVTLMLAGTVTAVTLCLLLICHFGAFIRYVITGR